MYQVQVAWPYYSSAVQPLTPPGVQPATALVPRLDILESARELVCIVETPGVSADSIDLEIIDRQLSISGTTTSGLPREGADGLTYRYRERLEGRFQRLATLPYPVDAAAARADYRDGLLIIRLPKTNPPAPGPRRITVNNQYNNQ